jgi:hypothetical protein
MGSDITSPIIALTSARTHVRLIGKIRHYPSFHHFWIAGGAVALRGRHSGFGAHPLVRPLKPNNPPAGFC